MRKDFTFIDLFAGIGGMRLAFEKVGGKCVFSSEFEKFARESYFANFNEFPSGDITKIKNSSIPSHDILLAGFPCQPFSNAGYKLGFEDTRGTLFFDVARIIKSKKPSMVLLENVKGLRSHDNGRTIKVIENTLDKLGYDVFIDVLNSKDFGLPQNRERVFIVCFNRNKLGRIDYKFPTALKKSVKLGDILENSVDLKYTLSDKLWQGHQRRKNSHKIKGNGFGYSIFNADSKYTSTISARYYKDGSEILITQLGKNPRKITPREAARLQGYPEKFKIVVSDVQAYKQFGNSVSVPVIYSLAKSMVKYI